jgi:Pyridoxamine 5'-phosphate oxidase
MLPIAAGGRASSAWWTRSGCAFLTMPATTCSRPRGNISRDPRVGLLFVDFASGATLQLTGRARILWDSTSFSDLPGAERAVEIEIDQVVELEGRVAGGSRLVAPSPFNP